MGDGDEIDAIRAVEAAFGVGLDWNDAPGWVTAGDVFVSLRKALPAEASASEETWYRFARALGNETGVDPDLITPESPLLDGTQPGCRGQAMVVLIVLGLGAAAALIRVALGS